LFFGAHCEDGIFRKNLDSGEAKNRCAKNFVSIKRGNATGEIAAGCRVSLRISRCNRLQEC
jgi:hypothetical protein